MTIRWRSFTRTGISHLFENNPQIGAKSCFKNLTLSFRPFSFKFFADISPFYGATHTPVVDFWWHVPWLSKQGWIPFCVPSHLCDPQINLWCNTCWLYGGQYGSQAFLIHVPADVPTNIGSRAWNFFSFCYLNDFSWLLVTW